MRSGFMSGTVSSAIGLAARITFLDIRKAPSEEIVVREEPIGH